MLLEHIVSDHLQNQNVFWGSNNSLINLLMYVSFVQWIYLNFLLMVIYLFQFLSATINKYIMSEFLQFSSTGQPDAHC